MKSIFPLIAAIFACPPKAKRRPSKQTKEQRDRALSQAEARRAKKAQFRAKQARGGE